MNIGERYEYIGVQTFLVGFHARVVLVTTSGLAGDLEWVDGPNKGLILRVTTVLLMLGSDWRLVNTTSNLAPPPIPQPGDRYERVCGPYQGSIIRLDRYDGSGGWDFTWMSGISAGKSDWDSAQSLNNPNNWTPLFGPAAATSAPQQPSTIQVGDIYEYIGPQTRFRGYRVVVKSVGLDVDLEWLDGPSQGVGIMQSSSTMVSGQPWKLVSSVPPGTIAAPQVAVPLLVRVGDCFTCCDPSLPNHGAEYEVVRRGPPTSHGTGWFCDPLNITGAPILVNIAESVLLDPKIFTWNATVRQIAVGDVFRAEDPSTIFYGADYRVIGYRRKGNWACDLVGLPSPQPSCRIAESELLNPKLFSRVAPGAASQPPSLNHQIAGTAEDDSPTAPLALGPTTVEIWRRGRLDSVTTLNKKDPCWRQYTGDSAEPCSCGNCLTPGQNRARLRG